MPDTMDEVDILKRRIDALETANERLKATVDDLRIAAERSAQNEKTWRGAYEEVERRHMELLEGYSGLADKSARDAEIARLRGEVYQANSLAEKSRESADVLRRRLDVIGKAYRGALDEYWAKRIADESDTDDGYEDD